MEHGQGTEGKPEYHWPVMPCRYEFKDETPERLRGLHSARVVDVDHLYLGVGRHLLHGHRIGHRRMYHNRGRERHVIFVRHLDTKTNVPNERARR